MKIIRGSLVLFLLSLVFLALLTVYETQLVGISLGNEKILTFLLLVLPAGTGALLAMLSLVRREGRTWLAVTLSGLNTLFALFHLAILFLAG